MKAILRFCVLLLTTGTLSYHATLFAQGPLAPTSAPTPSMKSLDQIEPRTPISAVPFTITQSGSYYVTKNLTMSGGYDGITINADNVIIDLGGFTLDGATTGRNGVTTNGTNYQGIQVRRGTLLNWTQRGIDLQYCEAGVVENIISHHNAIGIYVNNSAVHSCVTNFNSSTGMSANFCLVRDCDADVNPVGITLFSSSLHDSRVGDATDTGINASRSVVENCTLDQNHYGIVVQDSNNIHHNSVLYCGSDGIRATGGNSTIADNNVSYSGGSVSSSGIWVPSNNNRILHNNVCGTTGFGIGVAGSYNTVDGNSILEGNNTGISVSGGVKNTIVRNSSLGNGSPVLNYSIASGNNPGTIDAANASTNSWSNTQ